MKREHNTFQTRKGKQNIFRIATDPYGSFFTNLLFGILAALTKYPSYFIEVFMKRNFGSRYFSLSLAIIMSIVMFSIYGMLPRMIRNEIGHSWKLFILIFIIVSIRRRMEIRKFGSTYDFDKFSYSDGERLDFVYKFLGKKVFGITIGQNILHMIIEPLIPIVIGLFLTLIPFTQSAGVLILLSAVCFAIRNFLKVQGVRDHILDINDQRLSNEWKRDVIVERKPKSETAGLSLPIDLPKSKVLRENLAHSIDEPNHLDIWDSSESKQSALSINN